MCFIICKQLTDVYIDTIIRLKSYIADVGYQCDAIMTFINLICIIYCFIHYHDLSLSYVITFALGHLKERFYKRQVSRIRNVVQLDPTLRRQVMSFSLRASRDKYVTSHSQ